jgi:hypothetical protein
VAEYEKPTKHMETEGSLFHELVKEYWSHIERKYLGDIVDHDVYSLNLLELDIQIHGCP